MNVLCVDIGGTNIRVGLGAGKNFVDIVSERVRHDVTGQIVKLSKNFSAPDYVSVASAGPIDIKHGVFRGSPNFPVKPSKVATLEKIFETPVMLVNECVAAAAGEKFYGAGKNIDNLAYVTWSTGIGCGPIIDGRIITGKDGNAHEVGHIVVDMDGRMKCMCGKRGHWEAYCGGKNIPGFAESFFEKCGFVDTKITDTKQLFAMAKTNHVAAKVVDEICRINGMGIANIINAYDPELITIGGAIMLNNTGLVKKISDAAEKFVINRMPKITVTRLGGEIVLYGAMAVCEHRDELFLKNPAYHQLF